MRVDDDALYAIEQAAGAPVHGEGGAHTTPSIAAQGHTGCHTVDNRRPGTEMPQQGDRRTHGPTCTREEWLCWHSNLLRKTTDHANIHLGAQMKASPAREPSTRQQRASPFYTTGPRRTGSTGSTGSASSANNTANAAVTAATTHTAHPAAKHSRQHLVHVNTPIAVRPLGVVAPQWARGSTPLPPPAAFSQGRGKEKAHMPRDIRAHSATATATATRADKRTRSLGSASASASGPELDPSNAYHKCLCETKHWKAVLLCDGCDAEFCLCCVGLNEVPPGKLWFCPGCPQEMGRAHNAHLHAHLRHAKKPASTTAPRTTTASLRNAPVNKIRQHTSALGGTLSAASGNTQTQAGEQGTCTVYAQYVLSSAGARADNASECRENRTTDLYVVAPMPAPHHPRCCLYQCICVAAALAVCVCVSIQ